MNGPASIVVFLGPTLPHREAAARLDAQYLPPASQGDVVRAIRRYQPRCIGLVDGLFLNVAAVWHRELLWALSQGIHVFGASSMGALRAAELAPFGMRGIGRVATAYTEGRWPGYDEAFEDDDEVAVIHAPFEAGCTPLSDAMVDLRDTLLAAEAAAIVTREQRDVLCATMRRLHFSERSFARLAASANELGAAALPDWLHDNRVHRKRLDAIEALDAIAGFIATDPPPFQPAFRFERALVWERFIAECESLDAAEQQVLDELRLDPGAWRETLRCAAGQRDADAAIASTTLEGPLDRFRRQRSLWRRADLDAWLEQNALDAEGLHRLLREEAWLDSISANPTPRLARAMADHLRRSGRFAPLLARARAKAAASAAWPPPPRGPQMQALLEWYFEQRLGEAVPPALDSYPAANGWHGEAEFVLAIWREYLFNRELQ